MNYNNTFIINQAKVLFILVFCFVNGYAQTITIDFPHFAGKNYDFIIFQGDKQETVMQGTIPADGRLKLIIPEQYTPYHGMSRWLITNSKEGGGLDLLISGKDFSVSCPAKQPDDSNIIYRGNTEIQELNHLSKQQQDIVLKYSIMQQALHQFSKTEPSYSLFEKEAQAQKSAFDTFQGALARNPDYAKKFIPIVNITKGIGTELPENDEQRLRNIAAYIVEKLDWKVLYTSGHWATVINSWVDIHAGALQDQAAFSDDFKKITAKIEDKKLYKEFAERTAYALTKHGKDAMIASIAPYVVSSGKIDVYENKLSLYKAGAVGSTAPDLVFTGHTGSTAEHSHETVTLKSRDLAGKDYKKSLLVFYESGCGPCENLLQQLPGNYAGIQAKGIRMIAISADKEEEHFKNTSAQFPWKEAYCDYEGTEGINFKSYAIAGTPTMVLIDADGEILLRTASLAELLEKI